MPNRPILARVANIPLVFNRIILILLSIALLVGSNPTRAAAGPDYMPTEGPIFSDPTGGIDSYKSRAITNEVDRMIRNAPPYSVIRIATLNIDTESTKNEIIKAHQRRVSVRMILPDNRKELPVPIKLAKELNRKAWKGDTSYLKFCHYSCFTTQEDGVMHAKLMTLSRTGAATDVTFVSSQNLSRNMIRYAYNDAYIMVGKTDIYRDMKFYFDSMTADGHAASPIRLTQTDDYKMLYYPDVTLEQPNDIYSKALNKVSCKNAGDGHGNLNGRTKVLVSLAGWQSTRNDIAKRLVDLRRQGCVVQVLVSQNGASPKVLRTLLDGDVRTRYTDIYDENGLRIQYSHSKFIAISGVYGEKRYVDTVITGSANMALGALTKYDNTVLQIRDNNSVYKAYEAQFNKIWERSPKLTYDAIPAVDVSERYIIDRE